MVNIRKTGFWLLDSLTGGKTREQLRQVDFLNQRTNASKAMRSALLQDQLNYVVKNVPYYSNYPVKPVLSDFPILQKHQIRENRNQFISKGLDVSMCHETSTSGSTGSPFRVFHSKSKRSRINAESIFFGAKAGYELGDALWHLKIWTARNQHSFISRATKNILIKDVSSFDIKDVDDFFKEVNSMRNMGSIIAYGSVLETIARAIQLDAASNLKSVPRFNAVIGQSEPLIQEARIALHDAIGVYPVGRYGMEELGVLAQQDPTESRIYHLNMASHMVEVLKLETDECAERGELGRIVVTELINRAQPLIRYETGDLGIIGEFEDGTNFVQSLESIEGRSRDRIYDQNDQPLAPMIAYNFWWKFPEIIQYQIRQFDKASYELRIASEGDFDRQEELVSAFQEHVGKETSVAVLSVAEGFRLKSGKRKVIVSDYVPPMQQSL